MPRHDPTAAHPTPTSASREARPLPRPSLTGAGLALSSPRYLRAPGRGGLDYGLRDGSPGGGRRPARAPSTGPQGSPEVTSGHSSLARARACCVRQGQGEQGSPSLELASLRLKSLKIADLEANIAQVQQRGSPSRTQFPNTLYQDYPRSRYKRRGSGARICKTEHKQRAVCSTSSLQ